MVLLIDTNIILDVMMKRENFYRDSSIIWKLCETKKVIGYISALTFADLAYIMRKELAPEQIEDVLTKLSLIFEITELSLLDLSVAAKMKWNDFEDAIQSAIAQRLNADFIVSRNTKDFFNSEVKALEPAKIIDKI